LDAFERIAAHSTRQRGLSTALSKAESVPAILICPSRVTETPHIRVTVSLPFLARSDLPGRVITSNVLSYDLTRHDVVARRRVSSQTDKNVEEVLGYIVLRFLGQHPVRFVALAGFNLDTYRPRGVSIRRKDINAA